LLCMACRAFLLSRLMAIKLRLESMRGRTGQSTPALIGGGKPLRLTVKSGVCCPTGSPDNRLIAFRLMANGWHLES
jgi:hypothetical protein